MKKKRKALILIPIVLLALVICGFIGYDLYRRPANFRDLTDRSLGESETIALRDEILSRESVTILVAYYSYTGTTERVAESIAERTGADLFEIQTSKAYSNVYTESNREIRRKERPELASEVPQIDRYDIVFVGFPVWWHATPAPINTFLESYDLRGKLIIPFCTSSESAMDEPLPTFLDSCDGLAVYGAKRVMPADVDSWLSELGL